MSLLHATLAALALTLALELIFALVWGVRKEGLLVVGLMNLMTNPAANVLYYLGVQLLGCPPLWLTLALEAAVVAVEGICCRGIIRRPWLFALLVNLFSYGVGALIQKM